MKSNYETQPCNLEFIKQKLITKLEYVKKKQQQNICGFNILNKINQLGIVSVQ